MSKVMTMTASNSPPRPNRLRRLLTPPRFADEDKTRAAQFLNAILIAGLVLLGVRMIVGIWGTRGLNAADVPLFVLLAAMFLMLLLMRRGFVQASSITLLGLTLAMMVYVAKNSEGIHDGAFFVLTAVIVTASLLMNWKASAVVAALSIAAGWWLASQHAGTGQTLAPASFADYARDTSIVFILIVVLMYLATSSLRRALERSKASEKNLREQNVELTGLRVALEERVAERTAQLQTSIEVGRAAAAILDSAQLLNESVKLIGERFNFYYVAVFTLNPQGDRAILRAAAGEAGRILKQSERTLSLSTDSPVGYAISKRQARVALDVGTEAVQFADPLLPETRSEIALPLLVGDEVLGALDVQSRKEAAFDENDVAVLQNMSNQIATALSNAHSYERMQKSLEYTEREFEVGRALSAATTPGEAYTALGQAWALLPTIDRLQIYLVTARDLSSRPSEYERVMEWDVIAGVQVEINRGYAAADVPIITLGQFDRLTVIQDANEPQVPPGSRAVLLEAGMQAALLAPLRIREQFEGMVVATAERPVEFSNTEINLIRSMADQLAIVLNNLRLTGEMQTTLQRVELLNRRLSGGAWRQYLSQQSNVAATSGRPTAAPEASRVELPIRVRGQAIGAFTLEDANPDRQWSTEELSLFNTIADEVALAIDNARLIEQTERRAYRERLITEITSRMLAANDMQTIVKTAGDELGRLLHLSRAAIQVGIEDNANPAGIGDRLTTESAK